MEKDLNFPDEGIGERFDWEKNRIDEIDKIQIREGEGKEW